MRQLPATVTAYKKTPVFTQDSIPDGLARDHSTKAGVWALIHVLSGRLRYMVPSTGAEMTLEPGRPGVVEPEVTHRVAPLGPAQFYVEFYRESGR